MLRAARQALKQVSAAAGGQARYQRTVAASCLAYATAALSVEATMCERRPAAQKPSAEHAGPQAKAQAKPQPYTSRGYTSIIYPPSEAKVGEKAPEFTAPGESY